MGVFYAFLESRVYTFPTITKKPHLCYDIFMNIFLIRHGQTDWNLNKKVQGFTDIPLNDFGRLQAEEIREKLKDIDFDLVVSSPLQRAYETAKIICENRNLEILKDERIKERDFRLNEGIPFHNNRDFRERVWSINPDIQLEGSESYFDFYARVSSFLDELIQEHWDDKKTKVKNILLVAHGGIAVVLGHYFKGVPENENLREYIIDNCEVVQYKPEDIAFKRIDEFYISKSKYIRAKQCEKMYWLDKVKPDLFDSSIVNEEILKSGTYVGEVALGLFSDIAYVEYQNDKSKMIEDTKRYIEEGRKYIAEASFSLKGRFLSVDILKVEGKNVEIFEVKSSTSIREIYYDDIAYQATILSLFGFVVKKVHIITLNNQYTRQGDLDLNQLFNITDVSKEIEGKNQEILRFLEHLQKDMDIKVEPSIDIGDHCFNPYACGYFDYCKKLWGLPKESIFDLRNVFRSTKFNMYRDGVFSFEDLVNSKKFYPKLRPVVKNQLSKKEIINKEEIKRFLDDLRYPIYHLDFESVQYPVPPFDKITVYQQVAFQYSLHIEHENGELEHKEFLADHTKEWTLDLVKALIQDIPKGAQSLAYNIAFEKGIIKNLALKHPQYSDALMDIHDNMKDLMIPFKNHWYYNANMQGSYSIKYVLPALFPNEESLKYENLQGVQRGDQAMSAFRLLKDLDENRVKEIRKQLLEYCKLDTYAMVMILRNLRSFT